MLVPTTHQQIDSGGGGELSDFQYLSDQLDEMADEDAHVMV